MIDFKDAPTVYFFQHKGVLMQEGLLGEDARAPLVSHYVDEWKAGRGDKDEQCPVSSHSWYGEPRCQFLSLLLRPRIERVIGVRLLPTYTYLRVYGRGEELHYHRDRPSCEISVTINMGQSDPKNTWPIFAEDPKDKTSVSEVKLNPGDGMVYRGQDVPHWRDKFETKKKEDWQCQLFLHYIDRFGPNSRMAFDGRDTFLVDNYLGVELPDLTGEGEDGPIRNSRVVDNVDV